MEFETQTVVLVEDNPVEAKLYKRLIEACGYEVRYFDRPGPLVKTLDQTKAPLAIVSDINMPEMNGLEFLRRLEQHETWCTVPCALMTADPTRDQLLFARKLRVPPEAFLVKPVEPEAMEEMLAALAKNRNPVYTLRRFQRIRLALEIRTRREEREIANKFQESQRAVDEALKTLETVDAEMQTIKAALSQVLPADQKSEMTATLGGLERRANAERDRMKKTQNERVELQTTRRRLAADFDRESKLLEAQIRTAHDVVRRQVA